MSNIDEAAQSTQFDETAMRSFLRVSSAWLSGREFYLKRGILRRRADRPLLE
jgi:hypothetical protein